MSRAVAACDGLARPRHRGPPLAQTRQAERDADQAERLEQHPQNVLDESLRREKDIEEVATELRGLLETNTEHTREIRDRLAPSV